MYDNKYYTDELTGVLNRRYLHLIVNREISRSKRYNSSFSLIIADLDNFKLINDTFGHMKGDRALAIFADVMKKALRESDTIIRYGGDEFVIILPETSLDEAKIAAERILENLRKVEFQGATLSASMGVASYPRHGSSWEEIFSMADRALMMAKRMGKGRVALPDESQNGFIIPTRELVGRREETTRLINMLNTKGILHIVSGEVGVGKTRLVKDTLNAIKRPFIYVQSLGTLGGVPYFVLINLLKKLATEQRADFFISFERIPDPLKVEIIKLLPDLFPVASYDNYQRGDKYRLFESVISLLDDMFKDSSPILVFDDVQWIDRESAEFISYVVHMAKDKFIPLAVLRSEEAEKSYINEILEILGRMRLYDELVVNPLSRHATGRMLSSIMGGEVDEGLLDAVYNETGGNPFFIEEVVKSLADKGYVYNNNGIWYIKKDYRIEPSKNVEEVIKRKVRSISEKEKEILLFSAIYGRRIDPYVLTRASGINEGEVYDALDRLVRIGLLKERGGGDEYIFSEGIVIDTVLEEVSKGKLKFYHRKIADALKEVHGQNLYGILDELIYHYDMAGMEDEAKKYYKTAGDRAIGIYAYDKALDYYLRVLDSIDNEQKARDIAYSIYYIFRNLGNMETFESAMNTLLDKFPSLVGMVSEMLGDAYTQRGMFNKAVEILKRGIEHSNDEIEKTKLKVRLAWALLYQDKGDEAKGIVTEAISFYNEILKNLDDEEKSRTVLKALVGAYNTLASSYLIRGDAEKAKKHYREYLEFIKRENVDNEYNYAVGLVNLAIACLRLDKEGEAIESLKEAKSISEKLHSIYLDAMVDLVLGELYVIGGEIEKAGEYLEDAHKKYVAMNNEMRIIETDLSLYRYYLYRKKIGMALEIINEAMELARLLANDEYVVNLLKGKVEVFIEKGDVLQGLKIVDTIYSDYSEIAKNMATSLKLLKARLFVLSGLFDKAIDTYREIIKKEPENTEALLGIAEAMVKKGNIEEGIGEALKYEKRVYENEKLHTLVLRYRLGEIYIIGGHKDKGMQIMRELYPILERKGILLYIGRVATYIFD